MEEMRYIYTATPLKVPPTEQGIPQRQTTLYLYIYELKLNYKKKKQHLYHKLNRDALYYLYMFHIK